MKGKGGDTKDINYKGNNSNTNKDNNNNNSNNSNNITTLENRGKNIYISNNIINLPNVNNINLMNSAFDFDKINTMTNSKEKLPGDTYDSSDEKEENDKKHNKKDTVLNIKIKDDKIDKIASIKNDLILTAEKSLNNIIINSNSVKNSRSSSSSSVIENSSFSYEMSPQKSNEHNVCNNNSYKRNIIWKEGDGVVNQSRNLHTSKTGVKNKERHKHIDYYKERSRIDMKGEGTDDGGERFLMNSVDALEKEFMPFELDLMGKNTLKSDYDLVKIKAESGLTLHNTITSPLRLDNKHDKSHSKSPQRQFLYNNYYKKKYRIGMKSSAKNKAEFDRKNVGENYGIIKSHNNGSLTNKNTKTPLENSSYRAVNESNYNKKHKQTIKPEIMNEETLDKKKNESAFNYTNVYKTYHRIGMVGVPSRGDEIKQINATPEKKPRKTAKIKEEFKTYVPYTAQSNTNVNEKESAAKKITLEQNNDDGGILCGMCCGARVKKQEQYNEISTDKIIKRLVPNIPITNTNLHRRSSETMNSLLSSNKIISLNRDNTIRSTSLYNEGDGEVIEFDNELKNKNNIINNIDKYKAFFNSNLLPKKESEDNIADSINYIPYTFKDSFINKQN